MADGRPRLRELAARLGVSEGYRSALDETWVATSDATREALVRAMGFPAESERAAEASLARLEEMQPAPSRPPSAPGGQGRLDEVRPGFGIFANLYSVRSARNWGFGNLADLERLVGLAASEGASFVGINPLHATDHRPGRFCPYAPVSRLYRDPLYLEPERVPELTGRAPLSAGQEARRAVLRGVANLDTAATATLLFEVLRPLHREFRSREGDAATARRDAFEAYRRREGRALLDFAAFAALKDHFEAGGVGRSARDWRRDHRSPDAPAVRRFRERHEEEVEWHAWLQFELDRQLAGVAVQAREAGLPIGVYADLALGSAAGGSDVWSRPELFAAGVSVGAPPDAFCREGQDWGFPPLDPHALRRDGYAFWRRLLDANLRHAGALRLDHALALRRLFWIPAGAAPSEGAYVHYPLEELLAVLVEAAAASRAVLIAEDLGTVPEGFSEALQARGLLSSRVLLFERDDRGFHPAAHYPAQCLATANTHDLPTLAALDGDADLVLRRRVGQIADDAGLELARQERRTQRRELVELLVREGVLRSAAPDPLPDEIAAGATAFLCATPARLVGVSLDDLAGEEEPINLPGVGSDRHESWTRRMRDPLDRVFASSRARAMLDAVPKERRTGRG